LICRFSRKSFDASKLASINFLSVSENAIFPPFTTIKMPFLLKRFRGFLLFFYFKIKIYNKNSHYRKKKQAIKGGNMRYYCEESNS